MKARALTILLTILVTAVPSCWDDSTSKEASGSPEEGNSVLKPKSEEWSWEEFPIQEELTLATSQVSVHPKKSIAIKAAATGILTLNINEEVTTQKKGFLWAQMNTEKLRSEEEKIKIADRERTIGVLKVENIDIPEREAEVLEELLKARKKVELLRRLRAAESLEHLTDLVGISQQDLSDSSLEKAEEALARAEIKIKFARDYDKTLLEDSNRLKELNARDAKKLYNELKVQSEYHIPFNGELRINLGLIPGQSNYTVSTRETLATLNDYSDIHAHLAIKNAGWIALPPESLSLLLKDRVKTKFTFLADRFITDNRGREERNYIFNSSLQENENLKRLTGSTLDATLVHQLEKPCYIVPKLELSLYALERTKSSEWRDIIKDLFPEAELYAEGLENVAIYTPEVLGRNSE